MLRQTMRLVGTSKRIGTSIDGGAHVFTLQALQGTAETCIEVRLTVTTNTISEWWVDPKHAALNSRIAGLAEQGLTMQAIAETLNSEGLRSGTGKPFYAELVGALLSKARRKSWARTVQSLCKMELRVAPDRCLGQPNPDKLKP